MARRAARRAALALALLWAAVAAAPAGAVVGGAPPGDPAAWPWAVALLDAANPDPAAAEFCTGTLVRGEWVLTAAHCVADAGGVVDPAAIQVGAGASDLAGLTPDRRLPVDRVVVYPGYTPARFGHDIALLRLARPSGLAPAALGSGFREGSLRGWVAGFGLSGTGSTALLTGRITVSTPLACARYTRTLPASAFPHSPWGTVCGTLPASLEPSACFGDSGGPLADFRGAVARVIGVVSYGPGRCGAGVTTVYSDVGAYRPWIARVTGGGDPGLGLPEVRTLTARDAGRALVLRATWCQAGGRGRVLRAQFALLRLRPSGRAVPALTRTLEGRAPGECIAARTDVPDDLPSGAYEVRVKVIDARSGLSTYGLPAALRVS
jgi:secreted trypsin-like serine protease